MPQVFDLGPIAVSNWSLYLFGDLNADMELEVPNGVAAAADGIVSIRVGTDIGSVDVRVELHQSPPDGVVIAAGDDVVELAWRPVGGQFVLQTTFWGLDVEPIDLPAEAGGSYVVQVHSHNRDAVSDLLEVPNDFANRESLVIRMWPGEAPPERIVALQSRTARAYRAETHVSPTDTAGDVGLEGVRLFPFGEAVATPVSYNAFVLRDQSFVMPTDFMDSLALSVAKLNTLVSNVPGHLRIATGTERGEVNLTVRLADHLVLAPGTEILSALCIALGPTDEAVLVSHDTSGQVLLEDGDKQCHYRLARLEAGHYAVLVVAKGRDPAYRSSKRRRPKYGVPMLEEVLIVLWPDPRERVPDETVLQSPDGEFARIMRLNDKSICRGLEGRALLRRSQAKA